MNSSCALLCRRRGYFVLKWAILNLLWGGGQQQNGLVLLVVALAGKEATKKTTPLLRGSNAAFLEEGQVSIPRGQDKYSLYYRIYKDKEERDGDDNKDVLDHSRNRLSPLVVLHGGPSLPSQYLYPLVDHLTASSPTTTAALPKRRRNVLFYDQLGCGKSDEPKDVTLYSIEKSVDDLQVLLQEVLFPADVEQTGNSSSSIHLLGHSYGGVLAYEYVKRLLHDKEEQRPMKNVHVKSLILSNTPTSMAMAGSEYDRLYAKSPATFWNEHVCRMPRWRHLPAILGGLAATTPPALTNALANVGTVWSGMDVVLDWEATTKDDITSDKLFPPTLILGGLHDFGAKASSGWKRDLMIPHAEMITLDNCAHYPLLEDGPTFGRLVEDFCQCQEEDEVKNQGDGFL
jgi:proline iminopeptidase